MQYMLVIYEDERAYAYADRPEGEAWKTIGQAYTAYGGELAQAG